MKLLSGILLMGSLFFCTTHMQAFKIIEQSKATAGLGYGDWYINTDGELDLMKHLLKPEAIVFDVGGNIGEWSTYALAVESTINLFAFEPVPVVCQKLASVLSAYSAAKAMNIALSDKNGMADFFFYCYPPQDCGLSGFYYREVFKGDKNHNEPVVIRVQQQSLDSFCTQQNINEIDFLKIDTEGAELKILQGAESLLKNHQIHAIQFEYGGCYIDAKTTLQEAMRLLTRHGYVVFRIIPQGLVHIGKWESALENYNLSNYCALRQEDYPQYGLVKFD